MKPLRTGAVLVLCLAFGVWYAAHQARERDNPETAEKPLVFKASGRSSDPVSKGVLPASTPKGPPKSLPTLKGVGSNDAEANAVDLLSSESTFFDPQYHVAGKMPEGWSMHGSTHWGTKEGTVIFEDPAHPEASPSLYYRMFDPPMQMSDAETQAWLQNAAATKMSQRISEGHADYTNGEMVSETINDRPTLTWTATYTVNGQPWAEYLTRIYSPNGTVLFFLNAPASEMPVLVPAYQGMIRSTIVP